MSVCTLLRINLPTAACLCPFSAPHKNRRTKIPPASSIVPLSLPTALSRSLCRHAHAHAPSTRGQNSSVPVQDAISPGNLHRARDQQRSPRENQPRPYLSEHRRFAPHFSHPRVNHAIGDGDEQQHGQRVEPFREERGECAEQSRGGAETAATVNKAGAHN